MNLKKAFIEPLNGSNTQPIEVLFNPAEYTLDKSNQFQSTPIVGLPTPLTQFINGNARTLAMDLFFDTYEKGIDVRTYTSRVLALMEIDPELHAPPICRFVWDQIILKATVEKITSKFTMFLSDGTPVRATLNVSFKEYATLSEQLDKNRLHSADKTKTITTKRGDSLWQIASEQYGDPGRWRIIADANNIDDPLYLDAGRELNLPSISAVNV
jgi:Contractile injection system tube protein/LysM domain